MYTEETVSYILTNGYHFYCFITTSYDKLILNHVLFLFFVFYSVPFVMEGAKRKFKYNASHNCSLPDVAPTILDLLGVPKPEEMSGISLMEPY